MFGKLVKYELKDCIRVFLPLWAAALVLALVSGMSLSPDGDLVRYLPRFLTNGLPLVILGCLIIAMFVIALVTIIRRFFNDLLGEGGYLAFTLPVTQAAHLNSKLLTSFLMEFGCTVIAALSACIILAIAGEGFWDALGELFGMLKETIRSYPISAGLALELIFLAVFATAGSILHMYLAMAIGHLFNNHRGILSLIAYVVTSWVFGVFLKYIIRLVGRVSDWFPELFSGGASYLDVTDKLKGLAVFFAVGLLVYLIYDAVLWILTHTILKRHLNIL